MTIGSENPFVHATSHEDQVFAFSAEDFDFSKFHENKAKHDKRTFKRWLTVIFEVKKSLPLGNNWLKIFGLTSLWISNQVTYLQNSKILTLRR